MQHDGSDGHDADSKNDTELKCLIYSGSLLSTVIICKYRDDTIVHSKDRHKEEALKSEVNSVYGNRSL